MNMARQSILTLTFKRIAFKEKRLNMHFYEKATLPCHQNVAEATNAQRGNLGKSLKMNTTW